MSDLTGLLMVVLIVTNLVLLGTSRLGACVRIVAFQGIALGALPILMRGGADAGLACLVVVTVGLRGVVFPMLLLRALREANVRREVEPYVGYTVSILAGVVALAMSFYLASRISIVPRHVSALLEPSALATVLVGVFLIVSRKKAVTQVLGYLVLENGIYTLGVGLVEEMPMMVELGVLLDAFVAVFVMSIATWHISREFDHIDTEKLDSLKG